MWEECLCVRRACVWCGDCKVKGCWIRRVTQFVMVSKVKISPSMTSPKWVFILTLTPTTHDCFSGSILFDQAPRCALVVRPRVMVVCASSSSFLLYPQFIQYMTPLILHYIMHKCTELSLCWWEDITKKSHTSHSSLSHYPSSIYHMTLLSYYVIHTNMFHIFSICV